MFKLSKPLNIVLQTNGTNEDLIMLAPNSTATVFAEPIDRTLGLNYSYDFDFHNEHDTPSIEQLQEL